jgi:serine/threonine-protein kinase
VDSEDLPTVGQTIGGYRLDRLIATGGMGAVYAAVHTKLGRKAAVKVLDQKLASDKEYVSRFLHEARVVNDVRHPNIVDIYDFIETKNRVAFVMELLEGPTLARALAKLERFRPVQALNVAIQLLDALAAVHRAGIVHRDLKPQNVIVVASLGSDFDGVPSVKILDFGIAKHHEASVQHKTTTGSILGTPAYMAPEQVAAAPVSPATDLYAIAEILFEIVAGHRLFEGENLQVLAQKLKHQPPNLELPKDVAGGEQIVALVRAAVAPEPGDRPSLPDFKRAVRELLDQIGESTDAGQHPDFSDDDAAQTVLALEAPKFGRLDTGDLVTDDGLAAIQDTEKRVVPKATTDPGMNTQMFLNRIQADFEDISQPEPRPPTPKPEPLPSLKLDTEDVREQIEARHAKESAPKPFVVRGRPDRAPVAPNKPIQSLQVPDLPKGSRKKFLWLLLAPALATIAFVAFPGVADRARARIESGLGLGPNPVRLHLAEWKELHPDATGSAEEHYQAALAAYARDTWPDHGIAQDRLEIALILDPDHTGAIALYAENLFAWKARISTAEERAEAAAFLAFLREGDAVTADLIRAEAVEALSRGDDARCRALARAAQEAAPQEDPIAMLVEGECTLSEDAGKAESLAWSANQKSPLGRAPRVLARASARRGRYAAALKVLDDRLAADPKNGAALLTYAEILHAVGEHEKELERLRAATRADGDQLLAQLLLGIAQTDLEKAGSAKGALNSLGTNGHAPIHYRREALLEWAKLEIREGALEQASRIAAQAKALGADTQRVELECKIGLGQPAALPGPDAAPDALFLRAAAQLGGKRPDEAKHTFDAAARALPRDPRALVLAASARALLDDFAGARQVLDGLTRLDPVEVLDDDRAVRVSPVVGRQMTSLLEAQLPTADDRAVVSLLVGLLAFYSGDARAHDLLTAAADAVNAHPLAAIVGAHVPGDDPRRAKALADRVRAAPDSVARSLALARLDRAKATSVDAYAQAIGADPELTLAKVERVLLEKKTEELLALHTAHPWSKRLRRALYEAKL